MDTTKNLDNIFKTNVAPEDETKPKTPYATVEDLLADRLVESVDEIQIFDKNGDPKTLRVKYKKLTVNEATVLAKMSDFKEADGMRQYYAALVFASSVHPKFKSMDQVLTVDWGFVLRYAQKIERFITGDPFLSKSSRDLQSPMKGEASGT